ncbi:hypothetical protein [Neomegalonema sp.]|uniref:hypothetical protein n=1 Tax=Neomegalonema sp. TaxID=2039713 RepID=UPI00262E84E8|nr:hypothetical protein [Neomegalonema sp.]MDD2868769.1 hypothetical protein [Neomegalonema sp.]
MKRETWLAVTAALALAAFGGVWFAIKAPALADPGEPAGRPQDPLSGLRAPPSRRFYAPSVDHALMEIAARRPLFNQRRESYGTAASLALHPVASPDPGFTLAPLREPTARPLTGAAGPPDALAAPAPDSGGAVIETSALSPPATATPPPATSPNATLRVNLGPTTAQPSGSSATATPAPAIRTPPPTTPVAQTPPTAVAAATPVQTPAPTAPPPVPTPAPSAPAASGPPPSGPSIHPASLALAAVFPREGGRSAALIRLPDNNIVEGGVGATVAGWRIEGMTAGPPSSVTLWNGRERVVLRAGR